MRKIILIIFIQVFSCFFAYAQGKLIIEQNTSDLKRVVQVERWNIFQLNLKGPEKGNPFVEVNLSAAFKNGEKIYHLRGFYDGNGEYKIRFMPTKKGEWSFVTQSNIKELDGIRGKIICVAPSPNNHGPVFVRNTYHFSYADGRPYWPIGTTCYAWVHQTEELQYQTIETLKNSAFNKIRMCIFPKSYVYNENEPPYYPFPRNEKGENDFSRFNPEFFHHLESRLIDLLDLGIQADLILFHPYDRWGYASMSAETDEFYLKYVIARFAAFRNVWWSLANEFDLMKTKTDYDWDRFFRIICENDPYNHMRGIHNCMRFYDHSQPWVTHASIQSSELQKAREWREKYQKPVIYDECRYEGNIPEEWGHLTPQEMTERFWLGTIAGCYVGHGETYKDPNDIIWWSKGGVLQGKSPARIAFLKNILEEAPADGIEPIDKYSGGKKGEYYLYYFGEDTPKTWKFNLPENVKFQVDLIDTWNMKITKLKGIYSGSFELHLPVTKYLALRIQKVGYYFPIAPVQISPQLGLFYKPVRVKLWTGDKDAKIHYTLDGSVPTKKSPLYTKPFIIKENKVLNAIAFNDKNEKSRMTTVKFVKARLKSPVNVTNLFPGLKYKYYEYEGEWTLLPNFAELNPVDSGMIDKFTIAHARRHDQIGYVFEGFVKINKDGIYTFYCSSDDGSKLWVADSLIINNDGLHPDEEVAGQIGLRKGFYPIKVHFFENHGNEALKVSYKGPDLEKQIIPVNVLFHEE